MTLLVNTIEFGGVKAVINSYSGHPLLMDSMRKQLAEWTARFPNATVRTEEMTMSETVALVDVSSKLVVDLWRGPWAVGKLSEAGQ